VLVSTQAECERAVAQLKKIQLVAVDCEWTRTNRLATVQIADSADRVFVFDIATGGVALFDYGLKALLETREVVKVRSSLRYQNSEAHCC